MRYTDVINQMILDRKLVEDQLDKKTWKNLQSYQLCHEHNDLRYDHILRMMKKWRGGTIEQWITSDKCPVSQKTESGKEYRIDYGKGKNSVLHQFRHVFVSNPELAYEYKMFHTPENDHCPRPKSKGGQDLFDNCEVVIKYPNQSSLDLDLDDIIEACELTLATYKRIREKLQVVDNPTV